jgi:hypothetical protein
LKSAASAKVEAATLSPHVVPRPVRVAAWWLEATAAATAACGLTTGAQGLGYISYFHAQVSKDVRGACLADSLPTCIDTVFNVICAALLSGMVGPSPRDVQENRNFHSTAALAKDRHRRDLLNKMLIAKQNPTDAAAVVASMNGTKDTRLLLAQSSSLFKTISWHTLQQHPQIILEDARGASGDLAASLDLTTSVVSHVHLGSCDTFLSHSWSDNTLFKWKKLKCLCEK